MLESLLELVSRSPKGFRRPFNVVTRSSSESFLKYRLRGEPLAGEGITGDPGPLLPVEPPAPPAALATQDSEALATTNFKLNPLENHRRSRKPASALLRLLLLLLLVVVLVPVA